MNIITIFILSLFLTDSFSKTKNLDKELISVQKKYAVSKTIEMNVIKTIKLSLLETIKIHEGMLKSMGTTKLKIEFIKPQKTTLLINGNQLWLFEYAEGEKTRVTKTMIQSKGQSTALLTSILRKGEWLNGFKVKSKAILENASKYELASLKPNSEIKKLKIEVDNNLNITKLSYLDSIENETTLEFSNIKFNTKLLSNEFELKMPEDSEEVIL